MAKHVTILFIFLSFVCSLNAQSIFERVKSKTTQKVEQRTDDKLDEDIDKGLDKLEELFGKKSDDDKNEYNAYADTTFSGNEDDEVDAYQNMAALAAMGKKGTEDFNFLHQLTYTMKNYTEGELDNKMKLTMHFGGSNVIAMEIPYEENEKTDALMIFDMDNQRSLVLIDQPGMKMGMEYTYQTLPSEEDYNANSDKAMDNKVSFKKTGRTKTIAGYTCEEYITKQGETDGLVWTCNDADLPSNMFKAFSVIASGGTHVPNAIPSGFMMEAESWPNGKDGEEYTHMLVTTVELNKAAIFSSKSYSIIKG